MEPKVRPSVKVEIRSETLWHVGGKSAVGRVIGLLSAVGAEIHTVKPSRVDMCVDMQLPHEVWDPGLVRYRVTPSKKCAVHIDNLDFEGIDIGKGDMKARLYDKPREIRQKGQKDWMFDVWGLKKVIPDTVIIRVEFQIKRSILRELGIDMVFDLWMTEKQLWAYCTEKWLKFSTNPGSHHTSRQTFEWWKLVQSAYREEQPARPLIRCKALSTEQEKHFAQAFGSFTSLSAVIAEQLKDIGPLDMTFVEAMHQFKQMALVSNKTGANFLDIIDEKRKKFCREKLKIQETKTKRKTLGIPDNLSPVLVDANTDNLQN